MYNPGMHLPVAAPPVLCALLLAFAALPAHAADAAPAAIEFVMPTAGAFIASGPVVVAGRLPPDAGFVNLLLDGVPIADVAREGRTFSAMLAPGAGAHTVDVRAGALESSLRFTFGSGGRGAVPYRYHAPVLEKRCVECHDGVRRPEAAAEAATCKSCHRKLAVIYPYVHGPLAAGKCVVCHDPHGSAWPSLTVADAPRMCTHCHDQPGSLQHVEKARSRVCYLCHNPHASMNRKLLYDIVK
jgi:predicted CXXCH cytochrome family protein